MGAPAQNRFLVGDDTITSISTPRKSWTFDVALGLIIAIAGLSVFFVVVGLPGSYASVSESCSIGNQCVETQRSGTVLTQTPAAVIPLLAGAVVAIGLLKNRMAISWVGIVGLLVFSFLSLLSIGLLYMPFAIALVSLLSVIQSRKQLAA
jgi:hypothetical protein